MSRLCLIEKKEAIGFVEASQVETDTPFMVPI
jgi:hypothetical protein